MKRFIFLFFLGFVALCASASVWSVDNLPNVQKADHTKHLVNPDGIIGPSVQAEIDSLLLDARRRSSCEIVAVMVDDIDTPDDIDSFATRLFNSWGIGKKDNNNGILILVAKDSRGATIRTGLGTEGILPDITAGRIIRNEMFPTFREGDYERGMLAAVRHVHDLVVDPEAYAELHSDQSDTAFSPEDDIDPFKIYFWLSVVVAAAMLILLCVKLALIRKKNDYEKYVALAPYKSSALAFSAVCMGIPLVASVPLVILLNHWRNHSRRCPNCNAEMKKVDEVRDNDFLSPVQDTEERINSVDYDVWICPSCGETDVLRYVAPGSAYRECPQCKGLTCRMVRNRIIKQPTVSAKGLGSRDYECCHCGHAYSQTYDIEKLAPIVYAGSSGGRGGGFGGGGSFGGGFGGGRSIGGGASGHW